MANNIFDADITLNSSYWYSTNSKLSSKLANKRLTQATSEMVKLKNKRVLDVGCGDGVYTYQVYKKHTPKLMVGLDISKRAIELANKKYSNSKNLNFYLWDIYSLTKKRQRFDCAIVRGVLHHLDNPVKALKSIAAVTDEIVILEPNGYNPILKIIEKISSYHRQHNEKSYPPFKLKQWLKLVKFEIVEDQYIGLVPFFFPTNIALILKKLEPFFENSFLKTFSCGVYAVYAKRKLNY